MSTSHWLLPPPLPPWCSLTFHLCAVIPLKHNLNYEVLEKGHVRFWVQAIKLSPSVSYRFIANDKEITSGEVMSTSVVIMFYLLPWQLRGD